MGEGAAFGGRGKKWREVEKGLREKRLPRTAAGACVKVRRRRRSEASISCFAV